MNRLIFFYLLFLPAFGASQSNNEKNVGISPEAYLEYIKSENASVREQVTEFQKTIQKEREGHYSFVEGVYFWTSIGVGVLAVMVSAIIGFLAWNSREQVRKDFDQIMKERVREPAILNKLLKLAKEELSLEKGHFFFIANKDLHDTLSKELSLMKQRGINAILSDVGSESLQQVDVLIYRFNPSNKELGVDENLESIIKKLKKHPTPPPLVVYSPDRLWIKETTSSALEDYSLYHMANNSISLIDNTVSAYRVSQLTHATS